MHSKSKAIFTCLALSIVISISSAAAAQDSSQRHSREEIAARILKKFPEADTNKDGKLSQKEFQTLRAKRGVSPMAAKKRNRPTPPVPDVAYGKHEKQRFDLWPVPDAKSPTPLAIFIHGGGFRSGDKSNVLQDRIDAFLKEGIAFCSMNYRLSDVGPYPIMMHDAARGLQTIRHRAKDWNIDPDKIACYGGSAGAGISLWLAFHDDMADPNSNDPIARQSTRIVAAATNNGQSSYDIHTLRKWFDVPDLKHTSMPAFLGIKNEADLQTQAAKDKMTDSSPITHLTKDDTAPVFMFFSRPNTPVDETTSQSIWVHHVMMGLKLQEVMNKMGLTCIVKGPDVKPQPDLYETAEQFIAEKLKEKPATN